MKRYFSMAFFFWLLAGNAGYAQQDDSPKSQQLRLTGPQIEATFSGATHRGVYRLDGAGPYRGSYIEIHKADGSLEYIEDDLPMVTGRWRVFRDKLCFAYSDGQGPFCFSVYVSGNCHYFYAAPLYGGPDAESEIWTSRSVEDGETPDCKPLLV